MDVHDAENISPVVIHLLKGILYKEDNARLWESMEHLEGPIRDYLAVLNLDLEVFDSDGFAYLRSRETTEETETLPRLMTRRALSYPVSLVLALLRRKMTEHDAFSSEARLILEVGDIREMVSAFFPATSNEVKSLRRLDAHLQKIHDLGFIRFLDAKKEKLEVKRILKAYVDAQWLSDFDARLAGYLEHGTEPADEGNDDE